MARVTTLLEHEDPWRGRVLGRAGVIALAALLAGTAGGGPLALAAAARQSGVVVQQPGAIKVAIDSVHVDVTVTDQEGRFVHGLGADAFEVYEDGKPQPVSTFALVDLPVHSRGVTRDARGGPRVEPDVASNDSVSAGRVYIIVLDDLHVDALRSARVKQAARDFIERHLGPNDLAAVLHTSGRTDATQDFTSRRALLLQAVDKFTGRKMRSSVLERLDEYERRANQPARSDLRLTHVTDPLDARTHRRQVNQAERALPACQCCCGATVDS